MIPWPWKSKTRAPSEEPPFFSLENMWVMAKFAFLVFAFRWSFYSIYYVPSSSMEPTIKVGDRLIVSRIAYDLRVPYTNVRLWETGTPKRGDIIIFDHPDGSGITLVKRLIGLPGDRIALVDNILQLNDERQERRLDDKNSGEILIDTDESPAENRLYQEQLMGKPHWVLQRKFPSYLLREVANFPRHTEASTFIVPEHTFFAMGDNRDNSDDSRRWGPIPRSKILGKAKFVLWSLNWRDGQWPNLRWKRFFHIYDQDVLQRDAFASSATPSLP